MLTAMYYAPPPLFPHSIHKDTKNLFNFHFFPPTSKINYALRTLFENFLLATTYINRFLNIPIAYYFWWLGWSVRI